MKNKILHGSMIAGCTAGLALCIGCIGQGVGTDVSVGTTTVNNFGTGPTAQDVTEKRSNTAPVVRPAARQVIVLDQHRDLLRLNITSAGDDADAKLLADKIAQKVTGSVAKEDAIIGRQGPQDVKLVITPRLTLVDQDGDYYRMNCEIKLELKSPATNRIFGNKIIQIVGSKRVLGKQKAIAQFDAAASQSAADWCSAELKRIANQEVNVAVLNIQLPYQAGKTPRNPQTDAAYIKAIGDLLGKMPNFITYELVGQDSQTGICQYRIAYFRAAYPNGIANEIGALLRTVATHK